MRVKMKEFAWIMIAMSAGKFNAPAQAQPCEPWDALTGADGVDGVVYALEIFDDGSGPALYVGGRFTQVGNVAANNVVRWDGAQWSALGQGVNDEVRSLKVYDAGQGPALYVGGKFTSAGGVNAKGVARWNGQSWSALGSGLDGGFYGTFVECMEIFRGELYVGGSFEFAGGTPVEYIARWNGSSWSAVGPGLPGLIYDLEVFDDGGGEDLYAGGFFGIADNSRPRRVARWDGTRWSNLGLNQFGYDAVAALAVFEEDGVPALFVGGAFTSVDGQNIRYLVRWSGSAWSAVGDPLFGPVEALEVFDRGDDKRLYVGGRITQAGGEEANKIATWNGQRWATLGIAFGRRSGEWINALKASQEGLYVGGALVLRGRAGHRQRGLMDGLRQVGGRMLLEQDAGGRHDLREHLRKNRIDGRRHAVRPRGRA